MALEKLKSKYGPFNKSGKKGTGELRDTLALEGMGGLANNKSRLGTQEPKGKKPKGPDTGGNIPAEKLG
jgi:hypothetical protein